MNKRNTLLHSSCWLLFLALSNCAESGTAAISDSGRPDEEDHQPFVNEPIQPIPLHIKVDAAKVELGVKLFHDARLSANNQISCSSCHNLTLGGTDRKARSHGLDRALTDFNAPTVYNSAFNFTQFWDGRVDTLEEQIEETAHSIVEMGSSWKDIIMKLHADPSYPKEFQGIYPDGITKASVKDAIAEFERSLYTPNCRFDRFLRGEDGAVSANEKEGYRLFKTYGCINCHQGVGVGGNIFETFGVLGNPFENRRDQRKADLGRFNVTGEELDRFVFKVPSLRNVTLTPPYFHDGSVRELREAVMIMSKYQLGRRLTEQEVELIVQFLGSLTGEYKGVPLDAPSG